MREFFYSSEQRNVSKQIAAFLQGALKGAIPVIVCIGTDAVIGDCLGPITGSMVSSINPTAFVYGSLENTVTAKDVLPLTSFLKKVHGNEKILVIDAAVGDSEDVGKIRIDDIPIKPGLGAKKDLPALGDVSIIYVAAEKDDKRIFSDEKTVRLSNVYGAAKAIAEGISEYMEKVENQTIIGTVSF